MDKYLNACVFANEHSVVQFFCFHGFLQKVKIASRFNRAVFAMLLYLHFFFKKIAKASEEQNPTGIQFFSFYLQLEEKALQKQRV